MFCITLKDIEVHNAYIRKYTVQNDVTLESEKEVYKIHVPIRDEVYDILLNKLQEYISKAPNIILSKPVTEVLNIEIKGRDKITLGKDTEVKILTIGKDYTYEPQKPYFLEEGEYFVKDLVDENIIYTIICTIKFQNIETLLRGSSKSLRMYASWETAAIDSIAKVYIQEVYSVSDILTTTLF